VIPLCNGEHMVQRDRQTRCKHPEILTLPAKVRDPKSGKDVYCSVYSSIAPLILVDGHTTYVNHLVLVSVIDFVFAIVFLFEFCFSLYLFLWFMFLV
jgi:hypothetical protein